MKMRPSSMLRAAKKSCHAVLMLGLVFGLFVSPAIHISTPTALAAPGAILGNVFHDMNGNGERSVGNVEPGIPGIEVFVYDVDNNLVSGPGPNGAWVTGSDGSYSITSLLANQQFRLEFRTPSSLSNLRPAPFGANSATNVVFATAGDENVDVGFYNPQRYCEENPDTVTSCFVLGLYNGSNSSEAALVSVPYEAQGNDRDETSKLAGHGDLGTVYGLAYQRTTERIYASAYHKRFTGFGSGGPDAIYQLDKAGAVTGVFNLSDIGGAPAGTDVHDWSTIPNSGGEILDAASYAQVGRMSFGDLEISDDMSTLYVVNLADRKVYGIDVSTGDANSATVSESWDSPNACSGIEHRPFGLGWKDDRLYVGSVCEDASSAFVHSIDPAQGTFQLEVTVPLDYDREPIADASVEPGLPPPAPQPANPAANWNGWSDDRTDYYVTYVGALPSVPTSQYQREIALPQPMLSDIEFDGDDGMILGFRDRFGDQTGFQALQEDNSTELYSGVTAGDILRVCQVNNNWVVETGDTGACSADEGSAGSDANSGPGGEEYYYWDFFGRNSLTQDVSPSLPGNYHFETTSGGLLQLDGKETVLTTALDPFVFSSAGYLRLDNRTGQRAGIDIGDVATPVQLETGGYTIFVSEDATPTFGKANGLGDIEALCSAAPVEIGNRVWSDNNGNGIQDAGESPIAGVVVGLYDDGGNLISSATTDSNGTYYFSSGSGTSAANAQYAIPGLQTNSSYTVGLLDTNFAASSVLEGYVLTLANGDSSANGDIRDSDGQPLASPVGAGTSNQSSNGVAMETSGPGDNNHAFDFGLVQMDLGDLPENGTTFVTTGPSAAGHQIVSNVYLGAGVDRDADGQPTAGANGDDNDSNDDEDGVTFVTPLIPGATASIVVDANVDGFLNAWIDFNGNGAFDAGEQIAADQGLVPGDNTLTIAVPADATGIMYSRFRFTSDNPGGNLGATGRWDNGEVEDYVLAEIGDRVWLDNGNGGGAASDGIQNGSEPGVPNVTVELLDGAGQPVLDGDGNPVATTTDDSGLYSFPGLVPGAYQVRFVPPAGWGFTLQNSGDEAADSDADPTSGITDSVDLAAGEINPDVDAGLVALLSLGDLVWNDVNNNGEVDGAEAGIDGVDVTLWTVDGTGSPLDAIANQTTSNGGLYLFAGLNEGDYIVQVDSSNFDNGGPLAGYINSTGNGVPAPDPDDDINNDDNGDPAGGRGVLSQAVTLTNMGEPTNDGDTDNTTNLTVDFGFFATAAAIDIEKDTNGEDADTGTGPLVGVGSNVVWTYVVQNTGAVALANINVTDNIVGVNPVYVSGDANNDNILQTDEIWTYQANGVAIEGQYENISRVEGDPVDENGNPIAGNNGEPLPPVSDEDPSHYFGLLPAIDLEKATNGPGQEPQDADNPTGPGIPEGATVTWTYVVQNTGNVALANVVITDNLEGAICTIALLAIGATDTCTSTGTAVLGQYANVGTVTGDPVDEEGNPIPGDNGQPLPPVTDTDPSHYFGNGPASIDIEKDTNGEDADIPTGPQIAVNDLVVWTYVVRNTGEFALANVTVTDNIQGVVPQYVNGDNNNDTILQVDEVWTYQATGGATLGQYANVGSTQGDPVDENGNPVVDLNGNPLPSPQDSDPSHYVGVADASISLDKTVYVGHNGGNDCPGSDLVTDKTGAAVTYCFVITNTGSTHLTNIELNDDDLNITLANMTLLFGNPALLAPNGVLAYYYETTLVSDLLNTANTVGTPSNEAGDPIPGLSNVTDEDIAEVKVLAAIGDYVWLDTNGNGVQDAVELPLANINVTLYDGSGQAVDTTTTNEQGLYLFDALEAGDYSVGFTLPTEDHFFSPKDQASDDSSDSDADTSTGRTEVTTLSSGETDLSWDAGIYAPPNLTIEKSADVESAQPGTPIVYTFSYRNSGLSPANGVKVIETVPDLVTVNLAASATGWSCDDLQRTCVYELGTIPANSEGTVDLTFVVVTDSFFPEDITVIENNVRIEYDDEAGKQPNGAGLTDNHQTNIDAPTALDVSWEPGQLGPALYLPLISIQ